MSVRYVLYSHFACSEGEDFRAWTGGSSCDRLSGVQYLVRHLSRLQELLSSPGHEGLLILFYARGFADCLEGIAKGLQKDDLVKKYESLQFTDAVANHVHTYVVTRQPGLTSKLRFLTPLDLFDIFGRINWDAAKDLKRWCVGGLSGSHYDSPKIVEAIVRLRLLGTSVPVFRLDWDVLFRGTENENQPDLEMFKAIDCSLAAHDLRRDEADVATFLYSASYDTHGVGTPSEADGTDRFRRWSRAFATRIFPALPIQPAEIKKAQKNEKTWDQYANDVFDEMLARRFYGFSETGLRSAELTGIAAIGAHPLVSVISGALFCISEGAILDLPPFSNFRLNVSWIDDHLKYCLHRELRHLAIAVLGHETSLGRAMLDGVMVQKARAPIQHLPAYVLGEYMPTLLWGSIVDAWITPDPLLKYRPESLTALSRAKWELIPRKGQSSGVLSGALQAALERGVITHEEKEDLKLRLTTVALTRINEVKAQWGLLKGEYETFASIWAKGTVQSFFPELEGKCLGLAETRAPLKMIYEVNRHLLHDFDQLLEDAVDYIEWTLRWPHIVQVVRSVEQGTVRVDISWRSDDQAEREKSTASTS